MARKQQKRATQADALPKKGGEKNGSSKAVDGADKSGRGT